MTAFPDITIVQRSEADEFVILACDGIWDVMTNEQATKQMTSYCEQGEASPRLMCEEMMCDWCVCITSPATAASPPQYHNTTTHHTILPQHHTTSSSLIPSHPHAHPTSPHPTSSHSTSASRGAHVIT